MQNLAYINDIDIWLEFKARLQKGTQAELLNPLTMKEVPTNASPRFAGESVLITKDNFVPEARNITLPFLIRAETQEEFLIYYSSFMKLLQSGPLKLYIPRLRTTFRLYYLAPSSKPQTLGLNAIKLTLKFREPNPLDRNP